MRTKTSTVLWILLRRLEKWKLFLFSVNIKRCLWKTKQPEQPHFLNKGLWAVYHHTGVNLLLMTGYFTHSSAQCSIAVEKVQILHQELYAPQSRKSSVYCVYARQVHSVKTMCIAGSLSSRNDTGAEKSTGKDWKYRVVSENRSLPRNSPGKGWFSQHTL